MYNIIIVKAKWDRQIKSYFYCSKNIDRDIISKTALKVKICEKLQNQQYVANFSYENLWKYFDFMSKCSMNEYDSFKHVFSSIDHNNEKWAIPKLFRA